MGKVMDEENCGSPHLYSSHVKVRCILSQLVAACSKYLIMLNIGMGISYPTIAIPPILITQKYMPTGLAIDDDQASWFASLVYIWQPVGSMASVPISGLGRKRSMFFLQVPLFIGWLVPFFAESVWELYIAASVMGLGIGFMQAPIATYIGEVTEPKYRGLLACTAYCFLTLGSVCVYAIDVICGNWRHTALYCSVFPPLTAILLYIIPESPVWLVSKGRFTEGKKSLAWLRGWTSESEVESEFKTIVNQNYPQFANLIDADGVMVSGGLELDHIATNTASKYNTMDAKGESLGENMNTVAIDSCTGVDKETIGSPKKEVKWNDKPKDEEPLIYYLIRPEMYRPLLLSAIFLYLSNGVGVAVFRPYLVLIFKDFEISIDEEKTLVGVTTIGLLGNILSVVLMPLIGKRKLTIVAIILCAIGCAGIGFYDYFRHELNMTWIPVALMVEIFFATNLGVGHIPWVLMSEIFPLRGRTLATGFVAGFGNFLQFLGTKLYPTFVQKLNIGGVFMMYTGTYAVGLVYLCIYLFETEGKTLDEIVSTFRGSEMDRRI